MYVLGLDIGTTTICAVVTGSDSGAIVKSVTLPNDTAIEGLPFERLELGSAAHRNRNRRRLPSELMERQRGLDHKWQLRYW